MHLQLPPPRSTAPAQDVNERARGQASVQQMITSLQNLVAERFSSLERKFDAPVSDGALRLPVDYQDADFDDRDRWSVGGH